MKETIFRTMQHAAMACVAIALGTAWITLPPQERPDAATAIVAPSRAESAPIETYDDAPTTFDSSALDAYAPETGAMADPSPAPFVVEYQQDGNDTLPESSVAASPSLPVHIRIPAASVDAPVIPVGQTKDGKMDIPHNTTHAGWYERGALPGEEGVAVLAGHLDFGGRPGVFARLRHLAIGDLIEVHDDTGNRHAFRIRRREQYHVSSAPLREIFKGTGEPGSFVHLITCAGTWRTDLNHYDERLVIFAERVTDDHSAT